MQIMFITPDPQTMLILDLHIFAKKKQEKNFILFWIVNSSHQISGSHFRGGVFYFFFSQPWMGFNFFAAGKSRRIRGWNKMAALPNISLKCWFYIFLCCCTKNIVNNIEGTTLEWNNISWLKENRCLDLSILYVPSSTYNNIFYCIKGEFTISP